MTKAVDTRYTQERELSWLKFNERVLEEATDESVPLFERLKFAAIFTSNLDEFFMIRVGSIYDMTLSRQAHVDSKSGLTPTEQLQAVCRAVPPLYKRRDKTFAQLETRLRSCNICSLGVEELDVKGRKQVERWFRDYVAPVLSPMVVDPSSLPPPAFQGPDGGALPPAGGSVLLRAGAHTEGASSLPASGGAGRALCAYGAGGPVLCRNAL